MKIAITLSTHGGCVCVCGWHRCRHTCPRTHTLAAPTSSLSTWLPQRQSGEWGGGSYYSSAVINISFTFSGMQRCCRGLVTDGEGHYILSALVYPSLPPQDTNKPCCLQWTIQHRSNQIENRCSASHLGSRHSSSGTELTAPSPLQHMNNGY